MMDQNISDLFRFPLGTIFVVAYCIAQMVFTIMGLSIGANVKSKTCNADSEYFKADYCQKAIRSNWFDSILLVGGVINIIIWLLFCILYLLKNNLLQRWDAALTQVQSENTTLRTTLTTANIEKARIQRELNDEGNNRRPARVANPLPLPRVQQENEREQLLSANKSNNYQTL